MKLQIEKDLGAATPHLAHEVRSARDELLLAYLEHADEPPELVDYLQGFAPIAQIERHDKAFAQRAIAGETGKRPVLAHDIRARENFTPIRIGKPNR